MKLTVTMNGLISYAVQKQRIDALILAAKTPHAHRHDHQGDHHQHGEDHGHRDGDKHVPALLIPLEAIKTGVDSAAPDFVFDAGLGEYGVWRLEDWIVHASVDGKPPDGRVDFITDGEGEIPNYVNDGSLFWLPSISKAAEMDLEYRKDCLPPNLNRSLISAAVRIGDGQVRAAWASLEARQQVYIFVLDPKASNVKKSDYKQALADGLSWTLTARELIELRLENVATGKHRLIFIDAARGVDVLANISNKPATVNGAPVFEPNPTVSHFLHFYDIVDPPPPQMSRRVPTPRSAATKTNRCPGSSA